MSSIPTETLHITLSQHAKRAFEEEAARLHLQPAAYLTYLIERARPGVDTPTFDRVVNEVFGKFGTAMRKLAE